MQVYKGILLTGGVGYDCNIYLVDKELLVDTGTGVFFQEIKEEFENMRIELRDIKAIVNTHCHFDHSGADKKFRDLCKAKVAIHEYDKKGLEKGIGTLAKEYGQKAMTVTVDQVLKDGDVIKTQNFSFEVISTPGHTKGSICLYEKKKKILISGDTIFADGVGRTDYPTGNKDELKESIKKLSGLDVIYLLPGHGMPKVGGIDFLFKQVLTKM